MQVDLEPPKPTKEFHEAYLEIYGKGKKKTEQKQPEIMKDFSLENLELPPLKLTLPEIPGEKTGSTNQKKGLFSNIFKRKEEQKTKTMELQKLDLPPLKSELHKERVFGEIVETSSFAKDDLQAISDLEKLDLPPLKQAAKAGILERMKFPLFKKKAPVLEEPPMKMLLPKQQDMMIMTTPKKEGGKNKEKEMPGKIHDFLAEVKFGAREAEPVKESKKKTIIPKMPDLSWPDMKDLYPVEEKESSFERMKSSQGARDVQLAFEKKHPHETAGFEYLEKIEPLQKSHGLVAEEVALALEETPKMPKAKRQDFKTITEFKKYMKDAKEYEQRVRKALVEYKKKQTETQVWIKKEKEQEKRINEKTKRIETMERELQQKQQEITNYEPQLRELERRQDEIGQKGQEIKQRQRDVHETELRLHTEENAIIGEKEYVDEVYYWDSLTMFNWP